MCYDSITYHETRARLFEAYSLQVLFLTTCITSRIVSFFPNKNSLRNSGGQENLTSYLNLELKARQLKKGSYKIINDLIHILKFVLY